MATKVKIEFPKKMQTQGILAFPIKSDEEITKLAEWRVEKGIKKPKYDDKIGGTLFLTQVQVDRIVKHLLEVYMPFVDVYYKETDGDKGIEPGLTKKLVELIKKKDWSTKQLPIRELTDKDIENRPDESYVAKLKFMGPYESNLKVKGIVLGENGEQVIVSIDELNDEGLLPEGRTNPDDLWWGAGWPFKVAMRFNAFDTANFGVSAYVDTLYLQAHKELPVFGGNDDATIVEDGDDWVDED